MFAVLFSNIGICVLQALLYVWISLSMAHIWRSFVCCYFNNLNLFTQNESLIYGRGIFFLLFDSLSTFNFKWAYDILLSIHMFQTNGNEQKRQYTHCNSIRTHMYVNVRELCAIITSVCYLNETKAIIQISWMWSLRSVESNLINSLVKNE